MEITSIRLFVRACCDAHSFIFHIHYSHPTAMRDINILLVCTTVRDCITKKNIVNQAEFPTSCSCFCFSFLDIPAKTASGTIAIQVEDFNDHCPTLTSDVQTMCTTKNTVIVDAKDEDAFPNGPPFEFAIIPEGTDGKWQVEHLNGKKNILKINQSISFIGSFWSTW